MKGADEMAFGYDNSGFVQPLSMSRVSETDTSPDAAEVVRLVRLALGGEAAAFEQIMARYDRRVMTMAMRLLGTRDDAQDAAQEVFLRAFKYLHRLDLQKPIEPWLMQMTVNVCRDIGRKRQQHRNTFLEMTSPDELICDRTSDPLLGLAREQERRMMREALNGLPEKERLAIVLRDVEGLSTAEVAVILHSSETTVRSQISRGRLRMKEAIDRMIGGQP